ncbi:MAG: hypothetical protein RIR26_1205 [Pseudomonadota bacterium]
MLKRVLPLRVLFSASTVLVGLLPQGAFAVGDRVMGAATEGSQLRIKYIEKMERLDSERKQCRKSLAEVVEPQLALLDELGLRGSMGPARAVRDEAQVMADAARLNTLRMELIRLGQILNSMQKKSSEGHQAAQLQSYDSALRDYSTLQKRFDHQSGALLARSEKAVTNFVPFAQAVLQIKKLEACEPFWQELRGQLTVNMDQTLLRDRKRLRQQVADLRQGHQKFTVAAHQLLGKFKPLRQVASEDDGWAEE